MKQKNDHDILHSSFRIFIKDNFFIYSICNVFLLIFKYDIVLMTSSIA